MTARAKTAASTMLLPGLVAERERMFEARLKTVQAASALPSYICNASACGTYKTGDGEVLQSVRPGSLAAFALPSRTGFTQ